VRKLNQDVMFCNVMFCSVYLVDSFSIYYILQAYSLLKIHAIDHFSNSRRTQVLKVGPKNNIGIRYKATISKISLKSYNISISKEVYI